MNTTHCWARAMTVGVVAVLSLTLMSGCASVPDRVAIEPSYNADTNPAGYFTELEAKLRPEESNATTGIRLLASGVDAMAARVEMIRKAEHTIDLQYYLFHSDASGMLLFNELWQAAQRGVKVRLLLDDLEKRKGDYPLNLLDSHPNIDVRLYNPFYWRHARSWQLLGEFGRLNHRMHNKSLTADNRASVVGGRNVGDEYFGANQLVNFGDADVFLLGPSVSVVTKQFDGYWNSDLVFPLAILNDQAPPADQFERASGEIEHAIDELNAIDYLQVAQRVQWLQSLRDGERTLVWANIEVWSDKPDLAQMKEKQASTDWVISRLWQLFESADSELFLISPYFVPAESGTELLTRQAKQGVDVTVVTNALAATDVVAVHSGYAHSREDLLRDGVDVYEIKRTPDTQPKAWSISSTSSLHAKVFVLDRRWVFVGSFNLDPRSAWLNTEMGILIDSPEMAEQVIAGSSALLHDTAYQVSLNGDGDLRWRDLHSGQEFDREPDASWWRRTMSGALKLLPIESQL